MELSKRQKIWANLVRLFVLFILLIVMLRWFEHSQVYHPSRQLEPVDASSRRLFQDVTFRASDGVELNGWFFPAATNSPRAQWAFLICHGNGGNISHRLELCTTLLSETGANVFIFDYRGYGRSRGKPGEEGTYRDAQAAFEWLRQKGIQHIILFGESLGGGVASEVALREPVAGLILQSTFTSIPDIGKELYPWLPVRWISTIRYDTHSKLPRIKVPVLLMHSRTDNLIHFHHAEENFAAANEPKQFCELHGGHNEAVWQLPEFQSAIEKFLATVQGTAKE